MIKNTVRFTVDLTINEEIRCFLVLTVRCIAPPCAACR
jgi:hypothetical protein